VAGGIAIAQRAGNDEAGGLVAAKALDQEKQDGDNAIRLIQSAGAPDVGRLVNTYV
jgi:hypothetical protein